MIWLQLALVIILIVIGARMGGVVMGMAGGFGVAILAFLFGLTPGSPPIDVILIILAVVLAASAMQAAGGLDYLVVTAEKLLRRNPKYITIVAPFVSFLFTFMAGTGHIVYSLLPVITEVAKDSGIRPERPISASVIASQQAITASPISAAMAAMIGFMAPLGYSLGHLLLVCLPALLAGVIVGSLAVLRKGKELQDDPEYRRRVAEGLIKPVGEAHERFAATGLVKLSVVLFLLGAVAIVMMGFIPELRPLISSGDKMSRLGMAATIEIVMLCVSFLIVILCKPKVDDVLRGSVFRSGALAIVIAFGLAWMVDCFVKGHLPQFKDSLQAMLESHIWLFTVITFVIATLTTSQFATTVIVVPLGIALGLPAWIIVGSWMAVNANYFFPVAGQTLAAIGFDDTGTTGIGKYILNHSFMLPGLVNTIVSVAVAMLLGRVLL